jgi:LPXTG-motif cell wall-anchored protein
LRTDPSGPDPAVRPAAGAYSAASGSAPSPLAIRSVPIAVCPILGVGGNGCLGIPPWLIQQLAETGYGGMLALLAGIILCLAGIAGLTRRRRRRQALP